MIQYLTNEQIDRTRWDAAVSASDGPSLYATSWYLDLVSPDWSGLCTADYSAVMPLTHRTKNGIAYLYQPPFTQQAGVFGKNITTDLAKAFLKAIPHRFRFAEIMLNETNSLQVQGVEMLTNITLQLGRDLTEIEKGYNDNTRRNIKKAIQSHVSMHKGFDIDAIITLFKNNKGEAIGQSDNWYSVLKTVAYQLRHRGLANTYSAVNEQNEIIAGILAVESGSRMILLFSGSGSEAREKGAMHFLVHSILADCCNTHQIFDFEGSNQENLARFYLGFGGKKIAYPFVRINRLPLCMRWMKRKGISV